MEINFLLPNFLPAAKFFDDLTENFGQELATLVTVDFSTMI
jgi:hypothetical protein